MSKSLRIFLIASVLLLAFSGVVAIIMMDLGMFLAVLGISSFCLIVAGFTWSNVSSWRKLRGQKGEIIRTDLSSEETFDVLLGFFSKKHGFTKMRVMEMSRPSLMVVRLNSWMGMGRGINRPPGTMKISIRAHDDAGSEINFKFDFLAVIAFMYLIAVGFLIFGLAELFTVIVEHGSVYSMLAALFIVVLPIPAFQFPFTVTKEQRAYFGAKILQSLREFHKRQKETQSRLSPET